MKREQNPRHVAHNGLTQLRSQVYTGSVGAENIRLALAGEVAKVKGFPGHLNFGDVPPNTPRCVDSQIELAPPPALHKQTLRALADTEKEAK